MLQLECLGAKEGDCMILHHGDTRVLFDGGPGGVYKEFLKPWIVKRKEKQGGGPVKFKLGMVSHVDDDHIVGILQLTNEMVERSNNAEEQDIEFDGFWFNSFSGLTGGGVASANVAAITAAVDDPGFDPSSFEDSRTEAIVASIAKGHEVSNNLHALGLGGNASLNGIVKSGLKVAVGGMTFHVVGPSKVRLDKLQKDWEKKFPPAEVAAYVDKSVPNLSSIVVVVEADGKKLLMTGDARGDDILEGLEASGFPADGSQWLDVLKLPHHGSVHNVEKEFFEKLPARVYAVSADGKHGNPDLPTIEMIAAARGDAPFEIVFASEKTREKASDHTKLLKTLEKLKEGRNFTWRFRKPDDLSIMIDL